MCPVKELRPVPALQLELLKPEMALDAHGGVKSTIVLVAAPLSPRHRHKDKGPPPKTPGRIWSHFYDESPRIRALDDAGKSGWRAGRPG